MNRGKPHPLLDAWVSRLAHSSISRVVFVRFDWSDLPGSTDRFLSVLLSRSPVHLNAIGTVIWTIPGDIETFVDHVNSRLEEDNSTDPKDDPAFLAVMQAITNGLLHHTAPNRGIEARLRFPELVQDVDMERIADTWEKTVEKTLERLGPVHGTRPIAVKSVFVQDDVAVANGYRDIEPRAPGAWDALLPSELGLMDDTGEIDLFDIKAAENELLHFIADNETERRARRHFFLISDIESKDSELFFRFDIAAWYMAWWELVVRVLVERMAGDELEFTLVVHGQQPKRWRNMAQLLVARVKAVVPEVSLTMCDTSEQENTIDTNMRETWWIAPESLSPPGAHAIHCTSAGPRLDYLSATVHTSSVVHRYTNQLVDLLTVIEEGGTA